MVAAGLVHMELMECFEIRQIAIRNSTKYNQFSGHSNGSYRGRSLHYRGRDLSSEDSNYARLEGNNGRCGKNICDYYYFRRPRGTGFLFKAGL